MNRSKNSRPWLKWVMNVCCTGIRTNSAQAIVLAERVFLALTLNEVTFAAKLLVNSTLSFQLFFSFFFFFACR